MEEDSSELELLLSDAPVPFEDILLRTSCTHTHTCNPPGPEESSHSHTCHHTHTHLLEMEGEVDNKITCNSKHPRRPLGNREAVRKYREKKKAHTAFLEEEVKKLRVMNQQLVRRLQGQPALEAEVVRLRGLLADLRAKIDAQIGGFPFSGSCERIRNSGSPAG